MEIPLWRTFRHNEFKKIEIYKPDDDVNMHLWHLDVYKRIESSEQLLQYLVTDEQLEEFFEAFRQTYFLKSGDSLFQEWGKRFTLTKK